MKNDWQTQIEEPILWVAVRMPFWISQKQDRRGFWTPNRLRSRSLDLAVEDRHRRTSVEDGRQSKPNANAKRETMTICTHRERNGGWTYGLQSERNGRDRFGGISKSSGKPMCWVWGKWIWLVLRIDVEGEGIFVLLNLGCHVIVNSFPLSMTLWFPKTWPSRWDY